MILDIGTDALEAEFSGLNLWAGDIMILKLKQRCAICNTLVMIRAVGLTHIVVHSGQFLNPGYRR